MAWFALTGDERITKRCATDECSGQPTWRLESGGVGSDFCSGCKAQIEEQEEYHYRVAEEEYHREMERTHR